MTPAAYGSSSTAAASGSNPAQPNLSIILGLSQSRSTGQLIHIYPQLFFYLEFLKSVVTAEPQKDNAYNLRTTTRLMIHIDRLARDQNPDKREIFCRAYSQLVVQAFPALVKCLRMDVLRSQLPSNDTSASPYRGTVDVHDAASNSAFTQVPLSASNSLLLFVSQVFKFFLDMKFSLGHLDD